MTIKDFRDGNKAIVAMYKGEDKTHSFYITEDSGSIFNPDGYIITCEGRFSELSEIADFIFNIENSTDEYGTPIYKIKFLSSLLNYSVRENKIHFKVYATKDGERRVVHHGEIWFK